MKRFSVQVGEIARDCGVVVSYVNREFDAAQLMRRVNERFGVAKHHRELHYCVAGLKRGKTTTILA